MKRAKMPLASYSGKWYHTRRYTERHNTKWYNTNSNVNIGKNMYRYKTEGKEDLAYWFDGEYRLANPFFREWLRHA